MRVTHTPWSAPVFFDGATSHVIRDSRGAMVAVVSRCTPPGVEDPEGRERARIMAAAPAMIDALMYVQRMVESGQPIGLSAVNAAIKATGGDS